MYNARRFHVHSMLSTILHCLGRFPS